MPPAFEKSRIGFEPFHCRWYAILSVGYFLGRMSVHAKTDLIIKEQTRSQVPNGLLEHQGRVNEETQVLGLSEHYLWRILAAHRRIE